MSYTFVVARGRAIFGLQPWPARLNRAETGACFLRCPAAGRLFISLTYEKANSMNRFNFSGLVRSCIPLLVGLGCDSEDGVYLAEGDLDFVAQSVGIGRDEIEKGENGYHYYTIEGKGGQGAEYTEGMLVAIYYQLQILDGQSVAQYNESHGPPLVVYPGRNTIYPVGLNAALRHISQNTSLGVLLPSHLGFGDHDFVSIVPRNSWLWFTFDCTEIMSREENIESQIQTMNQYVGETGGSLGALDPSSTPELLIFKETADSGKYPELGDWIEVSLAAQPLLLPLESEPPPGTETFFRARRVLTWRVPSSHS